MIKKTSRIHGWSEAKYWGFIRSCLRRAFQRYPNKYRTQASAKRVGGKYECNLCKKEFRAKDVAVDHIVPCGTLKSFEDLAVFADNMFCEIKGLQILCKACHKTKTLHERGMSDEDIKVSEFRKLPAKQQKEKLSMYINDVGKNQAERLKQYRELL